MDDRSNPRRLDEVKIVRRDRYAYFVTSALQLAVNSFDCRGMNNIPGAKLSEHGHANALDIGGLRLTNGNVVRLTDPQVTRDFREEVKRTACERFSTVLGPGSDGYHEEHVHVDLMERAPGRFRFCHWDVRDPEPEPEAAESVPLPRPRPDFEREHAAVRGR